MADFPTLIFLPDSWYQPTCYSKLIKLRQKQHQIRRVSITLPSTKGDPGATFKNDIDVTRMAIASKTTHDRNVIIIAHSYGGMIGNSAIKGFTRPRDQQTDNTSLGYVVGLILRFDCYRLNAYYSCLCDFAIL
jgi:hypothetical protein